jgi:hypothetical protein
MSNGRKVVVTMTQAEASAVHDAAQLAMGVLAYDRVGAGYAGIAKLKQQLNAVRGKAVQRTDSLTGGKGQE